MYAEGVFFQAFVYLAAAVATVPLAKRLGLGSVLGYLIAGAAIGPWALNLVGGSTTDVMHFAEFGVVLMLFVVGLELQPSRLWRMRGSIVGLGGLQIGATAVALAALGLALGLSWRPALAVGLTLALSSTAIVLQTLQEKGLMRTAGGQNAFAVLLSQDIAVIPMLAAFPLLAIGGAHGEDRGHAAADVAHGADAASTWVEGLAAWQQTAIVLGAVAGIVVAGRFLVRPAFRAIAATRLRELFTAAALMLVVGIALLMARVGLSPALGTFLAGVVLADSEFRHELESDLEPFKGLLLGLFFIAVGSSIDFGLIGSRVGTVLGLVALLAAVKFVVLLGVARLTGAGLDQNLLFAFALAQGGEFAFVLFSFAVGAGVIERALADVLVAVVALSMVLTPLAMLVWEHVVRPRFGTREAAPRDPDAVEQRCPVLIAGFGRFGHIVGRLLTANGIGTTVLDVDSNQVDVLRKLGLKVFYGDASRHDLLHAAGAADARLLVIAVDDADRALAIASTARKHFPQLEILARARGRAHAYELLDAGVTRVYRETLDTSLRLGVDALTLLGFGAHRAVRAAQKFRCHDEATVRELAALRHDRGAYFGRARERIRELEELLGADVAAGRAPERDAAWDASTLREEYGERP